MEDAPKKFLRLGPGKQVRLKNSYIIQCPENIEDCVVKNEDGEIVEIHAELIPETKTGEANCNMKIKGKTIHWVSCNHCLEAEVRNYDRLWMVENPRDAVAAYSEEHDGVRGIEAMRPFLNPNSLEIKKAYVEKWLETRKPMDYLQFQRVGYYNVDPDSTPSHLVFNRTVQLTDTWKKMSGK